MSEEKPGTPEEAHDELKEIFRDIADETDRTISSIFGPLEESGISEEQFDDFKKEFIGTEDSIERARMMYKFVKSNIPDIEIDESFEDLIKNIKPKRK
jgi:hypothetical protein